MPTPIPLPGEAGKWSLIRWAKICFSPLGPPYRMWTGARTTSPERKQARVGSQSCQPGWFLCSAYVLGLLFSCSPSALTKVIGSFHTSLSQSWNFPEKTGLSQPRAACGGRGHSKRECLWGHGVGAAWSRWFPPPGNWQSLIVRDDFPLPRDDMLFVV